MYIPSDIKENWRWGNFAPHEVLSPHGLKMLRRKNLKIQGFALDVLQSFRTRIGMSVMVNHGRLTLRGWRSTVENKKARGVNDSPHVQGIAFDMNVYKMSLAQQAIATIRQEGFNGIGIYPKKNFIHGDCRTILTPKLKVVWNGSNKMAAILTEKHLSGSDAALLNFLKKSLLLPTNWTI